MLPGIVFILLGIGVIIYNTQHTAKLVIRGTNIDLGFLIIALGIINIVFAHFRAKRAKKSEDNKK